MQLFVMNIFCNVLTRALLSTKKSIVLMFEFWPCSILNNLLHSLWDFRLSVAPGSLVGEVFVSKIAQKE